MNEVNKSVSSPLDRKRYYQDDGISSLAFRHYKIGQNQKACADQKKIEGRE